MVLPSVQVGKAVSAAAAASLNDTAYEGVTVVDWEPASYTVPSGSTSLITTLRESVELGNVTLSSKQMREPLAKVKSLDE